METHDSIIVQDCGLCYFDPMTESFVDDKNCDYHRDRLCLTCRQTASLSTISHGVLGGDIHSPRFL